MAYPRKRAKRDLFGLPPTRQSLARSIRALAETKIKVNEGNFCPQDVNDRGTFTQLTDITTGDRRDDRVGDKIHISHIKLRLQSEFSGNLRVVLLCPKDPNQDMTANLIRETRYTNFDDSIYWVFYDQFFKSHDTPAGSTNGGCVVNLDLPRNQKCEFMGATSTPGTLARNPIYMYVYGANAAGANIVVNGFAKIYYKDI